MYQGDAVGNAVMYSEEQGTTFTVVFHKMDIPQRFIVIKGLGFQAADHLLQIMFTPRRRQGNAVKVGTEVKMFVCHPFGGSNAGKWFYNFFLESWKAGKAGLNGGIKTVIVKGFLKFHNCCDDH